MLELPINYKNSHWTIRKQAREQYVEKQGGKCYFCQNPLTTDPIDKVQLAKINTKLFPEGMFRHPIHLHHCHKTGMTLGAVHARCNAYMWQYLGE